MLIEPSSSNNRFDIEKPKNPNKVPKNSSLEIPGSILPPGPTKKTPSDRSQRKDALEDIFSKKSKLDFQDSNIGFHGGPKSNKNHKVIMWSFLGALIDLLVLISLSSMFILSFSFLMKTPFRDVLELLTGEVIRNKIGVKNFIFVFVISAWFYLNLLRLSMGATIGEWACSIRLGHPAQRGSPEYLLKLLFRSTIIVATGIITIPCLSLFFGKDLIGEWTGIKLLQL